MLISHICYVINTDPLLSCVKTFTEKVTKLAFYSEHNLKNIQNIFCKKYEVYLFCMSHAFLGIIQCD